MSEADSPPTVFISYSWSNQDHETWVIQFASELRQAGVDVRLDKWDLKPGHDANAFMERMVTDPKVSKVILVCDKVYADKSNGRSGGAGTEAQIITPELYRRAEQDKYVAVVRERDAEGKAYLPAYYGSRIYFDLSQPAAYHENHEKVLRWIWNEPLHRPPPLGKKPSFLNASNPAAQLPGATEQRRALDAVRSGAANSAAALNDYFAAIIAYFPQLRMNATPQNQATFDDDVVASIDDFLAIRNQIIEVFFAIAKWQPEREQSIAVHRFFEKLIPFLFPPPRSGSYTDWDFDNCKFIVHELFLCWVAILIQNEQFEIARDLLDTQFYWASRNGDGDMHPYPIFQDYLGTLEQRNRRLGLRRTSLQGDFLKNRCSGDGIDFNAMMTADFILYLRSCIDQTQALWIPNTLIYINGYGGAFEVFARSKSRRYFEKVKPLIGVRTKEELEAHVASINADPGRKIKWGLMPLNLEQMLGLNLLSQLQ